MGLFPYTPPSSLPGFTFMSFLVSNLPSIRGWVGMLQQRIMDHSLHKKFVRDWFGDKAPGKFRSITAPMRLALICSHIPDKLFKPLPFRFSRRSRGIVTICCVNILKNPVPNDSSAPSNGYPTKDVISSWREIGLLSA